MPWQDHYRRFCRGCDRRREEGERFSARGKCVECGEGHMLANARQLKAHGGPYFHHWRRAVAASVGAALLDSAPERQ